METALVTFKEEIFPQEAAKTGGSQQADGSPECAPSCPKLNLGEGRTARS